MGLGKLGQALTAREVFELLRDDLVLVEKEIHRESVASVDAITAIGQYLQEAGGKRLRPSLLLLSSKLIGDGGESAIRMGAVVEMIHAATVGALVAGADSQTEEKLGEYAWNLGMAFQLVDDVLDFTAREKTLGKPVGGDLREGKVTLPLVYALERASADERRSVERVLADRHYENVPLQQILGLIEKYNGIERVRERAQTFTDKARQVIGEFPESPYQRALHGITDLVTDRDH